MSYVYNLGQIRGGLKNGLNWPEITLWTGLKKSRKLCRIAKKNKNNYKFSLIETAKNQGKNQKNLIEKTRDWQG